MKSPKETKSGDGRHGRWYDDACGTAFAMEVIGERWAMLVVRELLLGGRRFSDLRRALGGISAKVLTERLEGLERAGAVRRVRLEPPASGQIYELTPWGQAAEPAVLALGGWAAQSPRHDPTLPLSPVALVISFHAMIDAGKAKGMSCRVGFDVGGDRLLTMLVDGRIASRRGAVDDAQVLFSAPDAALLAAVFYGKVPWRELTGQGVGVTGDLELAARFIDLFHLPPKLV